MFARPRARVLASFLPPVCKSFCWSFFFFSLGSSLVAQFASSDAASRLCGVVVVIFARFLLWFESGGEGCEGFEDGQSCFLLLLLFFWFCFV